MKRLTVLLAMAGIMLGLAAPLAAAPGDPGSVRQDLYRKQEELRFQRKRLDIINEREKDLSQQLSQAQAGLQESQAILDETRLKLTTADASPVRAVLRSLAPG